MKKVSCSALLAVVLLAAVLVMAEVRLSNAAVNCNPSQLSPCLPAITSSSPPSSACCSKLKEQKPCLCGYVKDPSLKQYVSSPAARRVASTCGVTIPSC